MPAEITFRSPMPPKTRATPAAALVVALLAPVAAFAQLPPTPDAKLYPQLAAMKTWLENGSPPAKHCALSGGLFLEANQLYRESKSEPKTIDAMMRAYGDKFTGAERDRLRSIVVHVAGMAAGFADLHADSAPVAFSQLCIGRAQKGGVLKTETVQAQFASAQKCELAHSAGSLDRKECLAVAFKIR